MKLKPEHFDSLQKAVLATERVGQRQDYLDAGLSPMRWRWDCLFATPQAFRDAWFREVYTYCNDDHVDTALRKITENL